MMYGFSVQSVLQCLLVSIVLVLRSDVVSGHPCEVMVYLGQKTARCKSLGLDHLPPDMAHDIKVLEFTGNSLGELGSDYFKGYSSLQEIYMTNNDISGMSSDVFRGLTNLQLLDLGENQITVFPVNSFRHITMVRSVSFKNNLITEIAKDSFKYLPNIESISFENCIIERIHPLVFQGLGRLTDINLVNNELSTLDAQMGNALPPNLSVLRLYRNPWNCDCRLRWLKLLIESTNINWDFSSNTPACSSPDIIRGLNWKFLIPEKFACASTILTNSNSSTSMEVQQGHNKTITCVVTGDPLPHITWFKGDRSLTRTPNKYTFTSVGSNPIHSTITIWNVQNSDEGDYKCLARNTLGVSEVTYSLWIVENELPAGGSTEESGISKESILGIAAGGAIFLLACVFCVVYGVRKHDRRKHAYKVRDYKKPVKDKRFAEKENGLIEKGQLSVMTGLLSDNKDSCKSTQSEAKAGSDNYQMREFTYHEHGHGNKNGKDNELVITENDMPDNDPLCDCAQTKIPKDKPKDNTPDLLQNDYQSPSKLHTASNKLNGSVTQCDQESNDSDYSSNDARGCTYNDKPPPSVIPPAPGAPRTIKMAPNSSDRDRQNHRQLPACQQLPGNKTLVNQSLPSVSRDKPPDRYMTLPARSNKTDQPVPGNHTQKHRDDGSGSKSVRPSYHSPAKSAKACPAPPPSPEPCYNKVPTVKFAEPEYRTINPDPRSIVVPSMGARSPMTGALSPASSSLSSPGSRGSMSPGSVNPRKPPRTFAATMEYLADSAEKLQQRREHGIQPNPRHLPRPGEKDEFGTCV